MDVAYTGIYEEGPCRNACSIYIAQVSKRININCCQGMKKIDLNIDNNNYQGKFINTKGRIRGNQFTQQICSC